MPSKRELQNRIERMRETAEPYGVKFDRFNDEAYYNASKNDRHQEDNKRKDEALSKARENEQLSQQRLNTAMDMLGVGADYRKRAADRDVTFGMAYSPSALDLFGQDLDIVRERALADRKTSEEKAALRRLRGEEH